MIDHAAKVGRTASAAARGPLVVGALLALTGAIVGLALWLNRSPAPLLTNTASAAGRPAQERAGDPKKEDDPGDGARFRAAELDGGTDWLNTAAPLQLRDLRGKIVLLDFWTLCCINCMHMLPDLARLEKKYGNQLVVVGVHSAKFENEKNSESIRKAILRYEIAHPVVNDANMRIWRRYMVNSWPTLVLIDPEGYEVARGSGEGLYEAVDRAVEKLIATHRKKKTLDEQPLAFKLARAAERGNSPLYFPGKVLADAAGGRLFIADSTHHRIVITDLDGKKIAIAGTGEPDKNDGPFDKASFNDPQGMALKGDTLYVADRKNDLIRALDLKAQTVKTFAGSGAQGEDRRNGGPALQVGLNSPWDLYIQSGKMYIAMAGHHQIWTLDLARGDLAPYAGNGYENIHDDSLANASFAQPSGLASDGTNLYVADSEVSAVRAVPLGGKGEVRTLVGTGLFDFGDRDGVGEQARLQHAIGVAYHDGKLFIADTYNSKIKTLDPATQTCKSVLGGKEAGWLSGSLFSEPAGLSFAGEKLYVADTNNHRIRVVDLKSRQVTTLPLQGVEAPKIGAGEERPSFPNATRTALPLTKVPADGEVALAIEIKPAAGFKLNPDARTKYVLETLPAAGKALEMKQVAGTSGSFRIGVPVAKLAGKDGLRLSVVYFECGEGSLGVCKIKSQIWDIPVKTDANTTERIIHLSGATAPKGSGAQ